MTYLPSFLHYQLKSFVFDSVISEKEIDQSGIPDLRLQPNRAVNWKKHGMHSLYTKCYFFGFSFYKTNFCNFSLASQRNNRQRYELWTAFIKEVPFCTSFFTQRCTWINFRSMKFYGWDMCFRLYCYSMLLAVHECIYNPIKAMCTFQLDNTKR